LTLGLPLACARPAQAIQYRIAGKVVHQQR
jgi:hypothetical protein